MSDGPRVVIVGGGFGGLEAAKRLCRASVDVTLVDRTNHHLFQPLLYQVATAGLSPAQIAAPIRSVLRKCSRTQVVMAEVVGVDLKRRTVLLDGGGTIPFDYLILSTGAQHSYFGHDEWQVHAPGLKTVEDATGIRRRILCAFELAERSSNPEEKEALMTFAIVGAGPTGVELAGSLAELARRALTRDFRRIDPARARIVLLEAGDRVLASFPPHLSSRAKRDLERLGVEVRLGTLVASINAQGVSTAAGEHLAARTVLWAAGVEASPAARWLGVQPDPAGRVPVSPSLEPEGLRDIFVIGDTARVGEAHGGPLPGVAPVAIQQASHAVRTILARTSGRRDPPPFRYVDKGNLATIGRASAVLAVGRLQMGGVIAWILWLTIHIMWLVGFRNRTLVLVEWAWAYLTYERGARLITNPDP